MYIKYLNQIDWFIMSECSVNAYAHAHYFLIDCVVIHMMALHV